jgi:tetratricopeptide (TPR) repeat protein
MRKLSTLIFLSCLFSSFVSGQHSGHALGKVDFKNSCSAEVQDQFQRSVAMLHSFRYIEAEKSFREVLAKDPSCAMAAWGVASLMMGNPLTGIGPSAEWAARGKAALDEARRIGAKSQREKDYIEAVAAYWQDWASRPEKARQLSRAKAYEALAGKYPDDDEAKILYALYLSGTQSLGDQSYAAYLAAAEILEKQFAKHPDHPGAAHYLIHSYDAPSIASKGLPAARRYAEIAPAAPHALHMPSHIFTRVGYWKDSVATNARSAQSAKADKEFEEQLHAMDYMTYANLQMGRDAEAKRIADEGASVTGFNTLRFVGPYAQAAMPARYALERGDWKLATKLVPTSSGFAFTSALTHFARALGAARLGDEQMATNEIATLARLRDELKAAKNDYWAGEVEISRMAAEAWLSLAKGDREDALRLMRAAAEMEDKSEKHIVTPGRLLPAREMLGDMLLELKKPAEALKEFEVTQIREPGRFRSFYGAAVAAKESGNHEKALQYFTKILQLTEGADERPETTKARAYVSRAKK